MEPEKDIQKTTKCLNCGTEFEGNFCPECGQNADTGRFTMKLILENLTSAILGRDGGVWFTLKSLVTRPSSMIVDILNGKRKRYFSPFPMLFFSLALYIVIISFTNNGHAFKESFYDSQIEFKDSEQAQAEIYKLFSQTLDFLNNHYTLSYIMTLPLWLLGARLCYGKNNRKRYYWAEYIITIVYASVIVVLFRCLIKLTYFIDKDLSLQLGTILSPIITIVAYTACFKKMLGFSIAKTAWRSVLVTAMYYILLGIIILIYVIISVIILAKRLQYI